MRFKIYLFEKIYTSLEKTCMPGLLKKKAHPTLGLEPRSMSLVRSYSILLRYEGGFLSLVILEKQTLQFVFRSILALTRIIKYKNN